MARSTANTIKCGRGRAHILWRRLPKRFEESAALLEPDAEIPEDQVRLAGHLRPPPFAAGSSCSGGTRRDGPLRPGRGPALGRRTAATHTYTGDGNGSRAAG